MERNDDGDDQCRFINRFNGRVLCQTDVVANTKGDRWIGVVDEGVADHSLRSMRVPTERDNQQL